MIFNFFGVLEQFVGYEVVRMMLCWSFRAKGIDHVPQGAKLLNQILADFWTPPPKKLNF